MLHSLPPAPVWALSFQHMDLRNVEGPNHSTLQATTEPGDEAPGGLLAEFLLLVCFSNQATLPSTMSRDMVVTARAKKNYHSLVGRVRDAANFLHSTSCSHNKQYPSSNVKKNPSVEKP